MGDEEGRRPATGPRRGGWTAFMACAWAVLGLWSLADGRTWVGVGWLVLSAGNVLVLVSPRAAAVLDAPLFRRRRVRG